MTRTYRAEKSDSQTARRAPLSAYLPWDEERKAYVIRCGHEPDLPYDHLAETNGASPAVNEQAASLLGDDVDPAVLDRVADDILREMRAKSASPEHA